MSSEKYKEAINAYNKATEINPQHSAAWYNKGFALYNLNRFGAIKVIYLNRLNKSDLLIE